MANAKEISNLVEREIDRIIDTRAKDRVRELLVVPYAVERLWDYGAPDQHFTCWTVLEHRDCVLRSGLRPLVSVGGSCSCLGRT